MMPSRSGNLEDYRDLTILRLRDEGKTSREIGDILGMRHEAVRIRWSRIDKALAASEAP